eukprot:SAG31_NODE_17257_length_677_cov_1.932526_1_plen_59_part_10
MLLLNLSICNAHHSAAGPLNLFGIFRQHLYRTLWIIFKKVPEVGYSFFKIYLRGAPQII